jgi:predicted nucleic acid-binding protein
VRLFLDTSVLLAACGSDRGASREVFGRAVECDWILLASPYVVEEVFANLPSLPSAATANWARLRPELALMDDVLTLDRAAVFEPAKDRPILFSALAWSEVLLTLDRRDFGALLGSTFYGLSILTPGMFLKRERAAGRLREELR